MTGLFVDRLAASPSTPPWVRTVVVPGRVTRTSADPDADLTVVSYRTDGGADGARAVWLDDGTTNDLGQEDGSAMSVLAVGDGVAVVSHGCSRRDDAERAVRSPVTSFDVVDLRSGSVRWSTPVPSEPVVHVVAGMVCQSWRDLRAGAGPNPPDVIRRVGDGSAVEPDEPAVIEAIAASRAARWDRDEARPRFERLVDGQEGFDDWALRVLELTGRLPVVRLLALRSGPWDVVSYFASPDEGGREWLTLARDGEVRLERRPTLGEAAAVELVGGAWDLCGCWWNGRWLAASIAADVVEFYRLD